MRLRGGVHLLVLFMLIISSQYGCCAPSHENFEKANEDYLSIISFFQSIIESTRLVLEYSFYTNLTFNYNAIITIIYNEENLNFSKIESDELSKSIKFTKENLKDLNTSIGSYSYLKNNLDVLSNLEGNISDFVGFNENIIINFFKIVEYLNNDDNIIFDINTISIVKNNLYLIKNSVENIQLNMDNLDENYSKDALSEILVGIENMLYDYERNFNDLVNMTFFEQPILSFYSEKDTYYLDETINFYGFFIPGNNNIDNLEVSLYFDNKYISRNFTDLDGSYEFSIVLNNESFLGEHFFYCVVIFDSILFKSEIVTVGVKKIPIYIDLTTSKFNYYINESIYFNGSIFDYKFRGIEDELYLFFMGSEYNILSDLNGNFSFIYNEKLDFGEYQVYAFFPSDSIHLGCQSEFVNISIDTPTDLVLFSNYKSIDVGEIILLTGRLHSKIDENYLANETIEVYMNDELFDIGFTDQNGQYYFSIDSAGLNEGVYTIYTRFLSNDVEWRDSVSEKLIIELNDSFMGSFSFAIIIVLIFSAVLFYFSYLFFRRKTYSSIQNIKAENEKQGMKNINKIKSSYFRLEDFIIDKSFRDHNSIKNAVISKYLSLLEFLVSKNMVFEPNYTHLDVEDEMIKVGSPRRETRIITDKFEKAMYSLFTFSEKDKMVFNQSIKKVFINFEGKNWTKQ